MQVILASEKFEISVKTLKFESVTLQMKRLPFLSEVASKLNEIPVLSLYLAGENF
jgi:hypothetical protein